MAVLFISVNEGLAPSFVLPRRDLVRVLSQTLLRRRVVEDAKVNGSVSPPWCCEVEPHRFLEAREVCG